MKSVTFTIPSMIFILLVSLLNYSCGNESKSKDNEKQDSTATIPIEISLVERGDVSANYISTATLEADQEAQVVSKVNGVVEKLNVEEGFLVKAGQPLAVLDDRQYRLEMDRAKAELDKLQNDFRRSQELYDKKLISVEAYENLKYQVESQQAAFALAKMNHEYTTIRAPIDGIVSKRLIKVGNMIRLNDPVFTITDFDPLLAIVYVPEHEMQKIHSQQPVGFEADAIPGKSFQGHVERISPIIDPETGTFKVTIEVNDPTGQLKPGMFTRIRIIYDTRQNILLVPKEAIISEDGVKNVYIIDNRMSFKREVRTGYANGSKIEIVSGLKQGDTVVTIGQSSLKDSSRVEIISQ